MYWRANWYGSPPESSVWEVDQYGLNVRCLLVTGNNHSKHELSTLIVEMYNNKLDNSYAN